MIDHIVIMVSDITQSKEYYKNLFQLDVKAHPTDNNIIMLENSEIHFFMIETNFSKEVLNKQHLSITTDSIDKSRSLLIKNGIIDFKEGTFLSFKYRNYKWIEWNDPDGIRLEFVEILKE